MYVCMHVCICIKNECYVMCVVSKNNFKSVFCKNFEASASAKYISSCFFFFFPYPYLEFRFFDRTRVSWVLITCTNRYTIRTCTRHGRLGQKSLVFRWIKKLEKIINKFIKFGKSQTDPDKFFKSPENKAFLT